jgi:hypothetical protein
MTRHVGVFAGGPSFFGDVDGNPDHVNVNDPQVLDALTVAACALTGSSPSAMTAVTRVKRCLCKSISNRCAADATRV